MLDVFKFPDFLVSKFSLVDLLRELNNLPVGEDVFECVIKFKHFEYNELTPFSYQVGTKNFVVYADVFVFKSKSNLILEKEIAIKFDLTEEDLAQWLNVKVLDVYFNYNFSGDNYISKHKDLVTALELLFFENYFFTFNSYQFFNVPYPVTNKPTVFLGLSGCVNYIEWKKNTSNIDVSNTIKLLD